MTASQNHTLTPKPLTRIAICSCSLLFHAHHVRIRMRTWCAFDGLLSGPTVRLDGSAPPRATALTSHGSPTVRGCNHGGAAVRRTRLPSRLSGARGAAPRPDRRPGLTHPETPAPPAPEPDPEPDDGNGDEDE